MSVVRTVGYVARRRRGMGLGVLRARPMRPLGAG